MVFDAPLLPRTFVHDPRGFLQYLAG